MEWKIMFNKILGISMLLATAVNANASSSNFGVTGTVTPEACNVTLTGGTVNLGAISTSLVKSYTVASNNYTLPAFSIPISITCSAATKIEVSFVDNQAGKNFPVDAFDSVRFGLIDGAGTTAIGSYSLQFVNTAIDTVAVGQFLSAANNTTLWSTTGVSALGASYATPAYMTGFAKLAGATTPDSLTTLSGTLNLVPRISTAYIGSAVAAIVPTGSGTLTLTYI